MYYNIQRPLLVVFSEHNKNKKYMEWITRFQIKFYIMKYKKSLKYI